MADTVIKKQLPGVNKNGYVLLTGTSNPKLAEAVGKFLDKPVSSPVSFFADGEISVHIPESIFKKSVFIIQPTSPPSEKHILELLFMIDAAKRAGASEIVALVPYFGYSRQDRKSSPRVPISSSVVAGIVEYTGADRIITVDIHSEQQQGFIRKPWDNIYSSYVLIPAIKALKLKNLVVVSPDKGGTARANGYAKMLKASGIAIVYKERDMEVEAKNSSRALDMIGYVKGRDALIVDDMIDTAGTMVAAAKLLKERGARRIYVAAAHGLFSKDALEKITDSPIKKVLITDTIETKRRVSDNRKIKVIPIGALLGEVIRRTYTGETLSTDLLT